MDTVFYEDLYQLMGIRNRLKLTEEKFPVSETLKVIRGITVYRTEKWWSAVTLLESFGRKQIATYL